MKRLFFLFFIISPLLSLSQTSADKILGVWLTQDKSGKIKIYKKGNQYYGKIIWMDEPYDSNGKPVTDKENPDAKLRSRPIAGMDIITNLVYEDGEWTDGNIYDPNDGKTYTCTLWLEDGKLKVRGYLGWFFDTRTWTRVK